MLFNTHFQTWHLIVWQFSHQPIRGNFRKYSLTNMKLTWILLLNPGPWIPCCSLNLEIHPVYWYSNGVSLHCLLYQPPHSKHIAISVAVVSGLGCSQGNQRSYSNIIMHRAASCYTHSHGNIPDRKSHMVWGNNSANMSELVESLMVDTSPVSIAKWFI